MPICNVIGYLSIFIVLYLIVIGLKMFISILFFSTKKHIALSKKDSYSYNAIVITLC